MICKANIKKEEDTNYNEISYIGTSELTWKNGWYSHKLSFKNRKYANSTILSKDTQLIQDKIEKFLMLKRDIVEKVPVV